MRHIHLIAATFTVCMGLVLCAGCEDEPAAVKTEKQPTAVTQTQQNQSPTGQAETSSSSPANAPVISLDKKLCDFGEVDGGSRKAIDIKITNTGGAPLKITDVHACCGCSARIGGKVVEAGESELVVGVGKSVSLRASCTFSSRPGLMRKTMYVKSNDPANPKVAIPVKATIVKRIDLEPAILKLFLDKENAGCPEITVTSVDGQPFSIRSFRSSSDSITADFDPSVEATRFVLQPMVNEKQLKDLNGYVELALTHPKAETASIAFSALPEYKMLPPVIILFNAEEGKPIVRKIWILNNYEEHFEIESVGCSNGIIEVVNQQPISSGYEFEVKITPPKQAANKTVFTDRFNVKPKGGQEFSVPCRGFYMRKTD